MALIVHFEVNIEKDERGIFFVRSVAYFPDGRQGEVRKVLSEQEMLHEGLVGMVFKDIGRQSHEAAIRDKNGLPNTGPRAL